MTQLTLMGVIKIFVCLLVVVLGGGVIVPQFRRPWFTAVTFAYDIFSLHFWQPICFEEHSVKPKSKEQEMKMFSEGSY